MNWESFGDFVHMGGYGLYVWGSYAVTLVLLAIEALTVARNERATVFRLQSELRSELR